MAERENERNNSSQTPGFNQSGQDRNREGEQNSYDNKNITNADRDRQATNAANQHRSEHPNMGSQREGQQQSGSDRDTQKITPEVPNREETHERQTPRAEDGNNPNKPQL